MLNFFNKQNFELPFDPELAIYEVAAQGNIDGYLNIRIASGDFANINKNIRVESKNIQEISLELDNLEKYDCLPSHPSVKFIEFQSKLLIKRTTGETDEVHLANHKVAIEGIYKTVLPRGKISLPQKLLARVKSTKTLTWPTFKEVEPEIREIWQDEFSIALDGYLGIESNKSNHKPAKPNKEKSSLLNKILNFGIIASLSYIVGVFGFNMITKNNTPQVENTPLEALTPEALMNKAQQENVTNDVGNKKDENSLESEILAEFGLEEGVNLDQ